MRDMLFLSSERRSRALGRIIVGVSALFLASCSESSADAKANDKPPAEKAASATPSQLAISTDPAPSKDAHQVTIVVLGSSSPAGKNIYKLFNRPKAEEPEYAVKYNWVTLYDARLKEIDPQNNVINLAAASGHSTSIALNEKKGGPLYKSSLAYALSAYPHADATIVNFPAIRGQEGEDVAGVVANLQEIEKRALAAGVGKVWIATAQPAANKTECFKTKSGECDAGLTIYQTRIDLTDAIIAAFPGRYLDFYSPLSKDRSLQSVADPALLNPIDKLHPNLAGHEALRDAVIKAGVYEAAAKN
ncbi:MAG: hypothetical protein AAB227_06815 [Pseudomonadota bacterium]